MNNNNEQITHDVLEGTAFSTSDGELFKTAESAQEHQDKLNLRAIIQAWLNDADTSVTFHSGNFEFAHNMSEDQAAMDNFYCMIQRCKDAGLI